MARRLDELGRPIDGFTGFHRYRPVDAMMLQFGSEREGGTASAQDAYIRNVVGSIDVTWRNYSETGASC